MMKKLALLLVLSLLLTLTASAAPTRESSAAALENQALVIQVQPLADAVAAAAYRLERTVYRDGTAPDAALVQAVLLQALRAHLLVAPANEGMIDLGMDEVRAYAAGLFEYPELPDLSQPAYPGVSAADNGLRFDTAAAEDYIGAHIYDIVLDEEELLLSADIYRLNGITASAVDAPEEALTWLGHIGLRLRPSPEAAVGFALASFSVPERYREAHLAHYMVDKRFELLYPDFLSETVPEEGALLSLADPEGETALKVFEAAGTLEELLQGWYGGGPARENGPAGYIDNGRAIYWDNNGLFRLAYADENAGEGVCLVLELRYPPLRVHEFELWQTFLDNSFVVYSHSVG